MRFLALPALLHPQIIQKLEVQDILNLSTCSSKINKIVKSSQVPLNCFEWNITNDAYCLELRTRTQNVFFFFQNRLVSPKTMTLNGFEGYVDRFLPKFWYFEGTSNSQLENMSKFILDSFKVSRISLFLHCKTEFRSCFIWNLTQKFHYLNITQNTPMSTEDLQFLLEEIKVGNHFCLNTPPPACPIPQLNHSKTSIRNSQWPFSSIINSNCIFLDVNITPSTENFNLLLKKWIAGEILKNLVTLRFFGSTTHSIQQVFNGVPHTPWTPDTEDRWFRSFNGYDCHSYESYGNGQSVQYDIVRNDGERATVALSYREIGFYVMDEEYKKRDGKLINDK